MTSGTCKCSFSSTNYVFSLISNYQARSTKAARAGVAFLSAIGENGLPADDYHWGLKVNLETRIIPEEEKANMLERITI